MADDQRAAVDERAVDDERASDERCPACGGERAILGALGDWLWFRCRNCGLVFDLPGCILPIPDGTSLPGGYKVEAHEVTLIGTCPECNGE